MTDIQIIQKADRWGELLMVKTFIVVFVLSLLYSFMSTTSAAAAAGAAGAACTEDSPTVKWRSIQMRLK